MLRRNCAIIPELLFTLLASWQVDMQKKECPQRMLLAKDFKFQPHTVYAYQ